MLLGVAHHLVDLGVGQTRVGLDGDLVFLAGGLVLGRHVQDAVGVDVEGHFDLGHATRCRRDAFEVELAQRLVGGSDFALTLEHLDGHGRLVVVGRREHLAELGRDGGVLLDHLGHHAAQGLDAQRQRRHVQQQHVLAVAGQHGTLHGRTDGHGFVRVHVTTRFLAEELLDLLLHLGHAGHAADQDHVVDVAHLDAGILDGGAAGLDRAFDQVFDQRFQLGARDLHVQVLRTGRTHGDVGQVDLGLAARRQFDLGLLGGFLQALQGQHVLGQVDTAVLLELADDVVDDALVEVLATQEGVTVGGQHLELLLAIHVGQVDDGHVERAATQVIDDDLAVFVAALVHAEGQGRGGGLVDDALDFQTGDLAGVLGGLTLAVVEVGRHGDDGLGHFLAEVVLGGFLHLAQHFGGDLRRGELLVAHVHPGVTVVGLDDLVGHQADVLLDGVFAELAADQALDGEQRVGRIGDGLTLGRCTDQDLAVIHVGDDGRRGARTLGVLDDLRGVAFHDRHARVGGAQVDTNDFSHVFPLVCRGAGRFAGPRPPRCRGPEGPAGAAPAKSGSKMFQQLGMARWLSRGAGTKICRPAHGRPGAPHASGAGRTGERHRPHGTSATNRTHRDRPPAHIPRGASAKVLQRFGALAHQPWLTTTMAGRSTRSLMR